MLDRWQLKDFDIGQGAAAAFGADAGWIDVSVPGDAYLAVVEAGRLAHPFEGRNEAEAAWVRDREWWQRTTFEAAPAAAGERVRLVFEGLDTFAGVYLDGVLLGRTDNMFRSFSFDITEPLVAGGVHTLAICFSPPSQVTAGIEVPAWAAFADRVTVSKRNLMRKAQFGWGWDWGPDLPTVGVWKPVRLERSQGATMASLAFDTLSAGGDRAEVRVGVELRTEAGQASRLEIALIDPDGAEVATASVAGSAATVDLTIAAPRLWWTADLGAQPLYTLIARLFDAETLIDTRERQVGIRTLTVDTSEDPDEPGTNFFRFVLNGVPIFAKGACWIPTTAFVGALEPDRYRDLLSRAARANMNMIRVWGGGIYEPDLFYDLCDELGLLVWQDFMFACANYPEDDAAFIENVRLEIAEQVRRLRGHACLALWCGNNENQAMQFFENQLTGVENRLRGLLYYDEIMPAMLAELDPVTPYWPGSPAGGPSPNSMRAGDVHNWTVWHGIPLVSDKNIDRDYDRTPQGVAYTRYAEDNCRFVSEFGIQAAPAMATLRRWMAPEDLVLGSPGLLGRVKDSPDKANAMMVTVTGLPTTLDDYIDFSMWTQAEGMKFGIEHFRRRKPHCSGALIWQYNDCWPCVSWSLIDYDGVAKASLYATTRAFAPVLASFKPLDDGGFELWITNDRLQSVRGQAVLALARMDGGADWSEAVDFDVPANASRPVWRGHAPATADRALTVRSPESLFPANRYLLAPISGLALTPGARPVAEIEQAGPNTLRVRLTASDYLAFVHLVSDRADLRFSDNYFDLAGGETAVLSVEAKASIRATDIEIGCWNSRT